MRVRGCEGALGRVGEWAGRLTGLGDWATGRLDDWTGRIEDWGPLPLAPLCLCTSSE